MSELNIEDMGWQSEPSYRLRVGDTVDIRFQTAGEFDYTTPVTPNGTITVAGGGEVVAVGKTTEELAQAVGEVVSSFLRYPLVTITVRTLGLQPVYVIGEVKKPGEFSSIAHQTVLTALTHAGGLASTADPSSVMIVRTRGVPEPIAIQVNVSKVLSGEDLSEDIELFPNDVVYAPRSAIGDVGNFVELFFEAIAPAQLFYLRTYDMLNAEYRRVY